MWRPGADVKCLAQSLSMTQALSPSLEVTVLAGLADLAGQRAPWVLLPSVGITDAPHFCMGAGDGIQVQVLCYLSHLPSPWV